MYDKETLDEMSDFRQTNFKRYPTIKFTAASGSKYSKVKSFTRLENDEDGELKATDLGKEIKVVFLKRGKFRLKGADYNTRDIAYSKTKEFALYGKTKKGKQTVASRGTWAELKEQFKLSAHQYPYVALEDGTVARLGILPSSLANYWEYCGDFKNAERIYEFYTTVKGAEELTQGKIGEYYLMEFARGKQLEQEEFDGVAEMIKELRDELQKAENAYQDKQDEYEKMDEPSQPMPKDDEYPIINEDAPPMSDEDAEAMSSESL